MITLFSKFTPFSKSFVAALLICTLGSSLSAQKVHSYPRLVVFVMLDELGNDQLTLLQSRFSNEGFNRIKRSGFVFRQATGNSLSGFEGTHFTSLLTGTEPSVHGVIDQTWLDPVTGQVRQAQTQTPGANPSFSVSGQVPVLPDYLRLLWGGKVQVAGISANLPEMVYTLGKRPDFFLQLDKASGDFFNLMSSGGDTLKWLSEFNRTGVSKLFSERQWGPSFDISSYREYNLLSNPQERKAFRSFLYDLVPSKGSKSEFFEPLSASPYGNVLVRDMAATFLMNSTFGEDDVPDFLMLGFSSRPYFRPDGGFLSVEKEDMLIRLDGELGELMKFLDQKYGRNNYLMVVASGSAPSFLAEKTGGQYHHSGALFEPRKASSLLNLYFMALYGQGKWVEGMNAGNLYLNHSLIEEAGLDLVVLQRQAADFLMQVSGVELAATSVEVARLSGPGPLHRIMWENYFPGRSGDVIFTLRAGWSYLNVNSGSPQNGAMGRSTLPLMLSGWKVKPGEYAPKTTYAALVPLLLHAFGLDVPPYSQGFDLDWVGE